MNRQARGVAVATLALGAAAVSLYFAFIRSPEIDLGTYDVLGVVAAEETAKLLGSNGQVLLMVPDTGADPNPSVEAEVKAFRQTLQKHAPLTLAIERVPVTPMLMMAAGGGLPPEEFFRRLDAHANAGALVLLFRFPYLKDDQVERLIKKGLKTVVVSSFYPDYQDLLDRRALHLAIVPRLDSPAVGAPSPRTVRERFDQQFTLIAPTQAR